MFDRDAKVKAAREKELAAKPEPRKATVAKKAAKKA